MAAFTSSAEMHLNPPLNSTITINGEINSGDYQKFLAVLLEAGPTAETIAISSNGGNVEEAINIGILIRKLYLKTEFPDRVPENYHDITLAGKAICPRAIYHSTTIINKPNDIHSCSCESACFLISVAGINRVGSMLGVHRAFMDQETYKTMNVEDAIEAGIYIKTHVNKYLLEMGVSTGLIDFIQMIPGSEIQYLSHETIEKELTGYIHEIEDWAAANCGSVKDLSNTEQIIEFTDCHDKLLANSRSKMFNDVLLKEAHSFGIY